ncbi:carboxylesterase family protein [Streptococcus parauberis]|uniref:carboxylesterase family protein n=1 Tax=Streptococcus parauberis TaxID=1348 RepID=UPI000CCF091A|nr:carboxylesterase family protein [Streptococcus parauberis]PNY19168.1 Para-nitrobenzyl esterase [Streptococcus parauberis]
MEVKKFTIGIASIALTLILVACQDSTSKNEDAETFKATVNKTIVSGKIKGHMDKKNDVIEWLGVPYAKSPVSELRWKAPQKADKWEKTKDVSKYGDTAIQFSNGEVKGSEDALNLDVVRPNNSKKDLPVVVYLHGGNNQSGTSQEIKGNTIVNDIDAVYVSVNYRLGALGFNPLEALKTGSKEENSGNYSLLDIAAALDWVMANAETFGGNKDNITLTGFSAGGRDVMATLISPIFKNKYNKAISFSGGMTLADNDVSQEIFAKAIAPLAVEDKKKDTVEAAQKWLLSKDKAVGDYLNSIKAERLAPLMGNAGIRMSVFPHLYKDGYVIPKEGFETSKYNDVPVMLVTGTSEFSMFTAFDKTFMEDFMSGNLFKDQEKLAEFNYSKTYGSQLYRLSNGVDSAKQMANKYKSPIYVTEIAYGDNKEVTPKLSQSLGSFHGIFEPMLQTPSNYKDFIGESFENDGAKEMSKQFKLYLKSFIENGDPNQAKLPKWDDFTSDNQVLSIDADKSKSKIIATKDQETADDILLKMKNDNTLTQEQKEDLNKNVLNGRWFSNPIDSLYNK